MSKDEFQRTVVDASNELPVLVDFWAPWCGPCRVLGPVLDRLAAASKERWRLVKVNTDEASDVSKTYSIRGIPAVKLFVKGKITAEFTGVMGEPAVRKWLEENLPSPRRTLLLEAEALLEEGHAAAAANLLQRAIALDPAHTRTRVRLAHALALTRLEEAAAQLEGVTPDPELIPVAEAIQTLHQNSRLRPDTLPNGKGRTAYNKAILALTKQDHEAVIRNLLEVLRLDRYYNEDGARKLGVALFTLLGPQAPLTRSQRRVFDMWLY